MRASTAKLVSSNTSVGTGTAGSSNENTARSRGGLPRLTTVSVERRGD
jgi:hypothetical protein